MKKRRILGLLAWLLVAALVFSFSGCGSTDKKEEVKKTEEKEEVKKEEEKKLTEATFSGADNVSVAELTEFDPLAGVSAKGNNDEDLTSKIEVKGEVNTLKAGEYTLTYTVAGLTSSVDRVVTVTEVEATPANGTYNYKFASADTRHTFMAAAEDYLLHTQDAGVPLFANAGFNLYSSRMQLVSESYIPVMGFGIGTSSMSADDSKVTMEDGKPGKAGEYTYRGTLAQNPSQWNHWEYDDATTGDLMDIYLGTLYAYEFNKDKTGYVLAPSMAAEDPIAVEGRELDSGKTVSKKWQIKIRDGLQWKFNSKTDTSKITKKTIDAKDFYETYKLALEKKWFRAISGGGDFVTSPAKIQNAQEFIDGKAKWEDVGIKLIDDKTIEFHFVDEQSQWNVKYAFGSFVMTPINLELYQALGDKYGLDEKSIAYTGAYYVDYYENDKIVRMIKNDLHHDADKYFYTGRTFTVIADAEMRFQEFLAGKLDGGGLPTAHYEEYKSHPGLKRVPGTTTFRMMINGLGNKENQLKKFPESKWTPEPILANKDFKQAIYHVIDRKKLAEEVLKTSQTQMYLFTDAYVVEAETGLPYRNTPQGMGVGADLSPSTFGYNLDASKAYFEKALDALVAEGAYKDGDKIEITFFFFSGSDAQELLATYLKDTFEAAFKSEKHNINVSVKIESKEFPSIYYDYMMVGEFDTSVGGISGSRLDAASFLDTYCADNRGGFTLNWGIDTGTANIPVAYQNDQGKLVKELWSFDAISSVLNGEIEVVNGAEKPKAE